jgi:lysophospholipase L1-like esterase
MKLTLCVALSLVACAALPVGAVAAVGTPVQYAALGDSYSSGEGNRPFDGPCHRAQQADSAYPRMLPSLVGYLAAPAFHACTGARIADIWQRPQPRRGSQAIQIQYLDASTDLVTLTIGGNDLRFSSIVKHCLLPGDCSDGGFAERIEAGLGTIQAELENLYRRIRVRMDPGGYLVVAGYPHLFRSGPEADCKRFISSGEAAWINSLVDRGNARIAAAVRAARQDSGNVAYVAVDERFAGHELCTEDAWLYGIKIVLGDGLIKGSYHPTKSGQRAYAAAFAAFLRRPAIRAVLTQ